jgi:hypothetical protein
VMKRISDAAGRRERKRARKRTPSPERYAAPVRVGIIGCGNVMDGAYMPVLEKLQHKGAVAVVGASHTSRDRCQRFLKNGPSENTFLTIGSCVTRRR